MQEEIGRVGGTVVAIKTKSILIGVALVAGMVYAYWIPAARADLNFDLSNQGRWDNSSALLVSLGVLTAAAVIFQPHRPLSIAIAVGLGVAVAELVPIIRKLFISPSSDVIHYLLFSGVTVLDFSAYFLGAFLISICIGFPIDRAITLLTRVRA